MRINILEHGLATCITSIAIAGERNPSEIQKRKCEYCKVERLSHPRQYPWAWIILPRVLRRMLLPRDTISEKCKNENVNIVRSLEANRIVQARVFTVLSRTRAIGSVTFVRNTVGEARNK